MTLSTFIKKIPWEALIWTMALIGLAVYSPTGDHHFTLCPIGAAGFSFCPGCGLGRSISLLLHGEVVKSFQMHPLGILAVIILTYRIVSLSLTHYKHYGKNS